MRTNETVLRRRNPESDHKAVGILNANVLNVKNL